MKLIIGLLSAGLALPVCAHIARYACERTPILISRRASVLKLHSGVNDDLGHHSKPCASIHAESSATPP